MTKQQNRTKYKTIKYWHIYTDISNRNITIYKNYGQNVCEYVQTDFVQMVMCLIVKERWGHYGIGVLLSEWEERLG